MNDDGKGQSKEFVHQGAKFKYEASREMLTSAGPLLGDVQILVSLA